MLIAGPFTLIMTSEEIINLIENKHAIQYTGYPVHIQELIQKYFNTPFYEARRNNVEFFSAFCLWANIPKEDYPYLVEMVDTYESFRIDAEAKEMLSETDNENLAKIMNLLRSMPLHKRILYVQSFHDVLNETM